MTDPNQTGAGGQAAADSIGRIGRVFSMPNGLFDGGRQSENQTLDYVAPWQRARAAERAQADGGVDSSPKKLPALSGTAAAQAWESLAAIAPRVCSANNPRGPRNLGILLLVHDVERKRVNFATRSDANRWQAVHTISDLINAVRNLVGTDDYITGLMTSSHGGWSNHGGFRMGNDTNGNGTIEGSEANDFVSTPAQAEKFGQKLRHAFDGATNPWIAVEACSSCGPSDKFLKALKKGSLITAVGSVGTANVGGSRLRGAWWTAATGRKEFLANATLRSDAATSGRNVWRAW